MTVWLIICLVISMLVHASRSFPIPVIPDHSCRRIRTRCLLDRRALRTAGAHAQRGHIVPATSLLSFTGGESGQRGGVLFFITLSRDRSASSLLEYPARVSHPRGSQQQQQPRVRIALRTAQQHCLEFYTHTARHTLLNK